MTRSASKLPITSLCALLLVSGCRSWQSYPDVSPADMRAGVQMWLDAHHEGHTLSPPDPEGFAEVELEKDLRGFGTFLIAILTAGLYIPLDREYELAVRPGERGAELAVDISERAQVLWVIPVDSRLESREEGARAEVLSNARRRTPCQRAAAAAVYSALSAVRAADFLAFRQTLDPSVEQGPAQDWWRAESAWGQLAYEPPTSLEVSWPPHLHETVQRRLFGQVTRRAERLWVTVQLGEERRRLEVQRQTSAAPERYRLLPPAER